MENSEQWLKLAIGKDSDFRPELTRIYSENGVSLATDGMRIHAINKGRSYPLSWKNLVGKQYAEEGIMITIDAEFLREAIPEKGAVHLKVIDKNKPMELFFEQDDETKHYVMIMPMIRGNFDDIPWRPADPIENEEEE